MTVEEITKRLVLYSCKAYERYMVRGTGGNYSARLPGAKMAITASGLSLGDTNLDNLITVDINSYDWEPVGNYIPSKEYRFHADILRLRPDVGAVLHVHPPYATAYAVMRVDIPMVTDAAFKQPPIPRVPFAVSGTEELQQQVALTVENNPGCRVLLLEQHGMVTLGTDVVNAYDVADLTEELAQVAYTASKIPAPTQ